MDLYIKGTGLLSPIGDSSSDEFLKAEPDYHTDRLLCREPNYSAYIPPMQLRRMSKAVRMGIGATRMCLKDAGVETADAISVGTALGCIHDTEVFLSKMVDQNEQMLTPTAFIQSTHNTVAGQIALVAGCHGHNLTFVHRGHSFEHAMINAQLYLNDHENEQVLVGGIEELTESSIDVFKQLDVYRKGLSTPQSILSLSSNGSIAGEGANFFLVSKQAKGATLRIKDIGTFISRDANVAEAKVKAFISRQDLALKDVDLVLLGLNGDSRNKPFYKLLVEGIFKGISQAAFKHLSGEYPVAGSFGLGLLSKMVRTGLPETLFLNQRPQELKRVLMVNNFLHHYSCWFIEVM